MRPEEVGEKRARRTLHQDIWPPEKLSWSPHACRGKGAPIVHAMLVQYSQKEPQRSLKVFLGRQIRIRLNHTKWHNRYRRMA